MVVGYAVVGSMVGCIDGDGVFIVGDMVVGVNVVGVYVDGVSVVVKGEAVGVLGL